MSDIKPFYPLPPAHVQTYVDALGIETTIEFLLNFGGSEVHLSTDPGGNGMVERVIGYEKTKRLAEAQYGLKTRVSLANKWLAQCLYSQGVPVATIALRLRRSDVTVRKYMKGSNAAPSRRYGRAV